MRFLSLFSGLEAASVAWTPLGWEAAAVSEIEPFPSAVLAHRYPNVPNLGDVTKHKEWPDVGPVDLVCGGSPCQSFSVAGLRQGMDDPRGNLALVYLAVVDRARPKWVVFENVPGLLSSSGGRDFGAFLGGLGQLGYGFAWRVLDAQHVRTRRFRGAVPQRRRRVFVVGRLGDWRGAAAVLFDRASLSGHPPPRREAGQGLAPGAGPCAAVSSGHGWWDDSEIGATLRSQDSITKADTLLAFGGNRTSGPLDVATAINAHGGPHGRLDFESETFVAHSLRAEGFDASGDGTGRGTPLVPVPFDTGQITSPGNYSRPQAGDPCPPLAARAHPPAVAFGWQNSAHQGDSVSDCFSPTLDKSKTPAVATPLAVRRLTPRECERLQGFPDDWTLIPWRRGEAPDGPRYKALGNSMAVNVMDWLGQRIALVDGLPREVAA